MFQCVSDTVSYIATNLIVRPAPTGREATIDVIKYDSMIYMTVGKRHQDDGRMQSGNYIEYLRVQIRSASMD